MKKQTTLSTVLGSGAGIGNSLLLGDTSIGTGQTRLGDKAEQTSRCRLFTEKKHYIYQGEGLELELVELLEKTQQTQLPTVGRNEDILSGIVWKQYNK